MKKPDQRILKALRSLHHHPDFEQVLRWIEETRQDLHADLESQMDDRVVRQAQGSAQTLKSFLDAATKAVTLQP